MVNKNAVLMGVSLSIFVVLTSLLSLHTSNNGEDSTKISTLPVGIATHVKLRQMDATGSLYYELNATKASQYGDNWYNLLQPSGFLNTTNASTWHFSANHGKIYQDAGQIELWENVIFKKDAGITSSAISFNTSAIRINTKNKTAYTPFAVKFYEPGSGNVVTALGMMAYLNSETLKLFSKVDSYYEPIKTNS